MTLPLISRQKDAPGKGPENDDERTANKLQKNKCLLYSKAIGRGRYTSTL